MADSAARSLSSLETYALWSEVYDEQPNPMLSLEERVLSALLPRIEGKEVVDLGCGTGRWLAALAHQSPATLRGIDVSAEMLERAAIKVGRGVKLFQGDCSSAPFSDQSADLILSSFVLSHLSDPYRFAADVVRLLRPGGTAFISDLHPRTVRALHWSRSFRHTAGLVHLGTEDWELDFLKNVSRAPASTSRPKLKRSSGRRKFNYSVAPAAPRSAKPPCATPPSTSSNSAMQGSSYLPPLPLRAPRLPQSADVGTMNSGGAGLQACKKYRSELGL